LFQLYDLIKSRVECDDFLEKIESAQVSAPQHLAGEDYNVFFKPVCSLVV